jgi:general secretion pathway protein D
VIRIELQRNAGITIVLALALVACVDMPVIPAPLRTPLPATAASAPTGSVPGAGLHTQVLPSPDALKPPPPTRPSARGAPAAASAASAPPGSTLPAASELAAINLEQVSLATFAQLVFADLLKKNVNIATEVSARRDMVTFRSGSAQTAAQIEAAAVLLLKSYGIAAIDLDGLVRIVPDNANLGNLPELRRGAALPDTPLPLRPIFHLVELQAVRTTDVTSWMRTLFGERVRAQEDAPRNAVLISGTPDNVRAALEAIRMLDQPVMAGGKSLSLTPVYLSAEDLARRIIEVLTAQGYAVQPQTQQPTGIRYPIVILPVSSLNAVYVFARGDAVMAHITSLAQSLDKPNERGVGRNFFTYSVRHKDAESLAQTLGQFLSNAAMRAATAAAAAAGGTASPASAQAAASRSGVVVDRSTNTLIFQASPDEYSQITALLQTLDRPSKAALIEVTVAELSVDDKSQLGIEFAFADGPSDGGRGVGGTLGGLGMGTSGFNYRILNSVGGVRVALNALASANKATILSSPRVLARNGESATIQVGQEVPIITSVQSTGTSTNTGTQVLQTIQYRNTGVILKVKPVIHSGDQIDLDVTQEVSAAQSTSTGVSASPTFSTRKVDTKLTLRNGATVMLGGLISQDSVRGDTGIPYLKDIPVVGNLFSNRTGSGARRELIVLITPYLVNDSHDAEELTEAFRRSLGPWTALPAPKAPTPTTPSTPATPAAAASQPAQ